MSIINQMYKDVIKKSICNSLKAEVVLDSIDNYLDFINYLDNYLVGIIKRTIVDTFEKIDQEYKHSERRKTLYYTKGRYPRTIMTLFGEITFEREYYVRKDDYKDGAFYVDKLFSLPKRDYYDPMIKALLIERSAEYSYIQAGKLVGDVIGNRFKTLSESLLSQISRQTVYNVIKSSDMDYIHDDVKQDVETLYIQLDEKYVYTQGNNKKMKEIKAAVIYTDIEEEYNGRNRLVNRHVISTECGVTTIRNMILEYITATYNIDKINTIILSGDGAGWITYSRHDIQYDNNLSVVLVLDRFHMHQAINHISQDPEIKKYLRMYLNDYFTKNFRDLCNALIIEYPHREEIISKNRDYLLNNWNSISHQKNPKFKGCSMEGHISHCLAALFTSRPKAHSLHMLSKRLKIRNFHSNNQDIKNIYLSNHINPVPELDYLDLLVRYPKTVLDVIGHKVTGRYKFYKRITQPSFS